MCKDGGFKITDGIGIRENNILNFSDTGIALYKRHGSVKWEYEDSGAVKHTNYPGSSGRRQVIIFGGKNKLTAEWPFFDIFLKWREDLERCETMWIVEYSFRDKHINAVVKRWMSRHRNRRLIVVDPFFPRGNLKSHPLWETLRGNSSESSSHSLDPDNKDLMKRGYQDGPPPNLRIQVLREVTGVALARLTKEDPHNPIL
jgi:hypothetical protein